MLSRHQQREMRQPDPGVAGVGAEKPWGFKWCFRSGAVDTLTGKWKPLARNVACAALHGVSPLRKWLVRSTVWRTWGPLVRDRGAGANGPHEDWQISSVPSSTNLLLLQREWDPGVRWGCARDNKTCRDTRGFKPGMAMQHPLFMSHLLLSW